jgi:riboflavin-specific deaminase-like protein
MMVVTLDGSFRGHDGRSGSISNDADQRVLQHTRRFAHAVLVGAGTVRAEHYDPLSTTNAAARVAAGLSPAPVLVIVSASLDLPWSDPLFMRNDSEVLVVTCSAAPREAIEAAEQHADVLVLPGERVPPGLLVAALKARGLDHVVCEGGPHLLAELIRSGTVDEADITIAPLQAAGGQIETGTPLRLPHKFRLSTVLEREDWLFTRYVRA